MVDRWRQTSNFLMYGIHVSEPTRETHLRIGSRLIVRAHRRPARVGAVVEVISFVYIGSNLASPLPGLLQDLEEGWEGFRPFSSFPEQYHRFSSMAESNY